jgi:2-keto-4-pentenoate hydratase
LDTSAAAEAAEILAQARRSGINIDALPEHLQPQSIDEAYQIQGLLIPLIEELSNGKRFGYKGGATAEGPQKLLGIDHPFMGVLISSYCLNSGDTVPADACKAKLLEMEFAFRMSEDLPPAAAPYDVGGVLAAVGSFLTSIEVVDLRYTVGMGAGGLQVIADNSAAGFWVQGEEFTDLNMVDFDDHAASLSINGEFVVDGNCSNVLGNPLNSLTWLANTLCMRGEYLKAGEIITAGSFMSPTPAQAGDEAVADFGALGKVSVRFGT